MKSSLGIERRAAASAFAVLAASVVACPFARAESAGGAKVELRTLGCEREFEEELRRIVRLELGGLLYEGPSSQTSDHEQIEVRCEPELARVSARDARRAQQVDHDLRLDAFPRDAVPRAVALAGVEALRAVDPTLAARIEAQRAADAAKREVMPALPAESPERTAPSPAAGASPAAARIWTRILVGGTVRRFVSEPGTTLGGARAELGRHLSAPIDFGFDLEGALSKRSVELGAIDTRLFSTGAWVGWRTGGGDWSATLGAGARVGVANLEGSSPDPAVVASESWRVWAGPLALARGDAAFGAFTLALALEAGWAAAGAEGLSRGATVVAVRGAWLALSLSPGIRF